MRVNRAFRVGLILALPIIIYFLIFFIYPLITLFQSAFTNTAGAYTLANFTNMLTDRVLKISLENTAFYFFGSVALEYSVGFGVAFLLYNYLGRLRSIFRTIIFLPLMVSPVVIGLMWLLLLNTNYGPIDYMIRLLGLPPVNWLGNLSLAMPSLIIANGWEYSPFVFLIIYAGLQMVPQQLYEAASVDGLTRFQTFRYITLPSIRASMIIAFLLNSIGVLKGFDLVYVLTNGGPGYSTYILSFYEYVVGFSFFETHYAAALAILFLIIIGAFVFVMLKFTSVEEYLGLRRLKE
ncbi:MAG: sugar ABC transporter permease [Nitrososphaerota archaeon]|nr:sugar ABC transporter permease [Nitrososphaerota archaeon]MDG7046312.1 sugar ABC transporter permease [Nitrososphaerota archaeon]